VVRGADAFAFGRLILFSGRKSEVPQLSRKLSYVFGFKRHGLLCSFDRNAIPGRHVRRGSLYSSPLILIIVTFEHFLILCYELLSSQPRCGT
jgi:hypothetical protein